MNPELRFHSIIISITTAIVFLIWLGLTKTITAYPFLAVILSGLISMGIYRLLALVLLTVLRNWRDFKKFILGPWYMEGTWVGFFVGHKNQVRLFVETFEQDLGSLVIRGRAFKEDGSYHGSWLADSANIEVKRAKLSYYYEADVVGNTFINPGLASFSIIRRSNNEPPLRLYGYSSDLFSPAKLIAIEEKISDETIIDIDEEFKQAKHIYDKNKGQINTQQDQPDGNHE